jgi:hypothetical protein
MKFLLTKQKSGAEVANYKLVSSYFHDFKNQKILNFSNFPSDFYYNISFKTWNKKILIFLLKIIIINIFWKVINQ